ncbi:MAG: DUF58 domain-containing protein [Clostridia bacterium]|nr:DUF58 domain-containing protein [Clostridia bacterium]
MSGRRLGYAAWLLVAACLYFFENGTGTRIVLAAALLVPLVPQTRRAFFSPDAEAPAQKGGTRSATDLTDGGEEATGDVRLYRPGDPIRLIHWKLSAKRDELLIRETAPEKAPALTDRPDEVSVPSGARIRPARPVPYLLVLLLLLGALLAFLPGARLSAMALMNRIFAASEAVNAYAYRYFPVPEGQSLVPACVLSGCALVLLAAITALSASRWLSLCVAAALALPQAYLGLALPGWLNVPLFFLLALRALCRPVRSRDLRASAAVLLISVLLTLLLFPGVDAATEAASEAARDRLSRLTGQLSDAAAEDPEGETPARHVHNRSLTEGDQEARPGRSFRLVTVEEQQISRPHWVDYLRIALLLLLASGLVILPFVPFILLDRRLRRGREERRAFASEDAAEAVCAIFRRVTAWLEAVGAGGGNRLYRDWPEALSGDLPEGYAGRFFRCAEDFEEAAYSDHALQEEARLRALALLKETEETVWRRANRAQRLRIRYWMGLCE